MEMNYIQQEIITHKNKLITLVNNLISTQIINEEIYINNEIKTESDFLNSLLNIKQNILMYQLNQNNNINFNPLNFQNNQIMNPTHINMNPIQMEHQQIIQNNMDIFDNNNINNNNIYDIRFIDITKHTTMLHDCRPSDKISDIIEKYRQKANDHNENKFLFNGKNLAVFPNSTLKEQGEHNNSF